MEATTNTLNWFEIPAKDIARAQKFYENIFSMKMNDMGEMMGMRMVGFPAEMGNGKLSGALVKSKMHKPSTAGCLNYLNANPSIQKVIGKIEKAGGKIVMPKTLINKEVGYMALFIDSEGNKMALHAQK